MSIEKYNSGNRSGSSNPVSIRLIELLADAEDVDPRDLPPLGRTIDLEALNSLIESASSDLMVIFSVKGYDVIVTGNGSVVLDSTR